MPTDDVFHEALQRPPAQRAAYLDLACGADRRLRARVEALLAAHGQAGAFLEEPAVPGADPREAVGEAPGDRIGPYKLLQQIGEGGMGVVYMAEQEQPIRRKVALKIIKLGMDTRQVVARFEAERQALALMDHPNIARVLDGGATEAGRPYFVMELVRGVPVTEYCDANQLQTPARLRLFLAVCRAVHHAHQKGVIHRDIKPSNVLVTLHDGEPVPKIIDFGIAKATSQRLTDKTLFTEFRQFIGTPEYMSPEQAEMSGLDVDTRTDIYSLGVLLYQLLTGTTPIDAQTLREAGLGDLRRMLRERETPSMSNRVSRMGAALTTVAKQRKVEPGALIRDLRGDLDWIVMKALEKDRTRRYETALDLAADIERHLRHEAVKAGPPSATYKLRKLLQRHRAAFAAAAAVVLALLLGLGASIAGFVRASREAERNREVSAFLSEVLAATGLQGSGSGVDVAHVLAESRRLFGDDHATVAAALSNLALQLQNAGELDEAEPLYRESLRAWRRTPGDDRLNVGVTLSRLGSLLHAKGDVEQAEQAFRECLAHFAELAGEPPAAGCDVRIALADLLSNRGEHAEAAALLEKAIALYEARSPRPSFAILAALENLLVVQMSARDGDPLPVIRRLYEEANAFYPPRSPFVAMAAFGYANLLSSDGQFDAAEPYLREALEIFRAQEEPPVVYYFAALDRMFQILRTRPEARDELLELADEVVSVLRGWWGADNPEFGAQLGGMARLRREHGDLAGALELAAEYGEIRERTDAERERRESAWRSVAQIATELACRRDEPPAELRRGLEALLRTPPGWRAELAGRFALPHGLLLYRLGRHEEARAALEPAASDARVRAPALAALALVEHALADSLRAEQHLAELRALEDQGSVPDWAQALVAEARGEPLADQ